jgi:hypothetical protein
VAILSGFVGLQYVPSKAMFVALNLSHVEIDKYEKLVPVVFSSRDGKNWSTGSIKPEIDLVSFDDIVYANNQKRFVTVGMKQTAEVIQTDTQNSADAITWAESKKPLSVPNSAFYSLAYSENRKRFVAAWLTTDTDGNNKPGGIATMEPTGEWVEAVMVPSCDGVPTLFSKPIIVTDPAGQEHFIVTPNYSEGCAYWATDPRNWYASSYSWK